MSIPKQNQQPKLSDLAREGPRMQPEHHGRIRCSACLSIRILCRSLDAQQAIGVSSKAIMMVTPHNWKEPETMGLSAPCGGGNVSLIVGMSFDETPMKTAVIPYAQT